LYSEFIKYIKNVTLLSCCERVKLQSTSHPQGNTQIETVRKKGAKKDICTVPTGSKGMLEKIT